MIQRLSTQLPHWMRPDHPLVRYTLGVRPENLSTRRRLFRALVTALLIVLFWGVGYVISSDIFQENPFEQPLSQMLSDLLFWPALGIQIMLQAAVLLMTINTVGDAKRRQMWDSLRTTANGAALTLRTRWSVVVFYRLKLWIGLLLVVRLILIGGLLFDLTAFRGEYLNYLTGAITPQLPLALGVVLLAFMMTASLLLPITTLGMDAAFGLLVSTFVQQRTYVALAQITFIALRIAIIIFLLVQVSQFRAGTMQSAELVTWLMLFAFAAIGDWGINFLYLGFYGAEVWANVPYSIFIGLALLVFIMLQAALTDGILALAIRRAERSE